MSEDGQTTALATTPQEDWLAKQTGVVVEKLQDGSRMLRLSRELAEKVNLLVPMSTHVQVDKNWTPVVKIIDIPSDEFFKVGRKQVDGEWVDILSPMGSALDKLARAAGIDHVKTEWDRNVAQGEGGGFAVAVTAQMRGPDGLMVRTTKSAVVRFAEHDEKIVMDANEKRAKAIKEGYKIEPADGGPRRKATADDELTEAELRRLVLHDHEFIERKRESSAFNRCIRHLFGLTQLTPAQAAKPFLLVSYSLTPDYTDPAVQRLVEVAHGVAADNLYGSGSLELPAPPPVVEEGTPGELPSAALGDEDFDLDPDEFGEQEELLTPGEGDVDPQAPPDDVPEEWPEDDEVVDATATEEPFAKPDGWVFESGSYVGKPIEEVVQDSAGKAYLAKSFPKMRSPEKKASVLAWLTWAEQREITKDNVGELV